MCSTCGRSGKVSTWEVRTKSRLFSLSVVRWIITNQRFPVLSEQKKKCYLHECKCATENPKGLNQQQWVAWWTVSTPRLRWSSCPDELWAFAGKPSPCECSQRWSVDHQNGIEGSWGPSPLPGCLHPSWLQPHSMAGQIPVREESRGSFGCCLRVYLNKRADLEHFNSIYLFFSQWCLPVESWWSNKAPACWAQAETEPRWWPPLDHHSYWRTACRSPSGWEVPPALDTTASWEMLKNSDKHNETSVKPNRTLGERAENNSDWVLELNPGYGMNNTAQQKTRQQRFLMAEKMVSDIKTTKEPIK